MTATERRIELAFARVGKEMFVSVVARKSDPGPEVPHRLDLAELPKGWSVGVQAGWCNVMECRMEVMTDSQIATSQLEGWIVLTGATFAELARAQACVRAAEPKGATVTANGAAER